MVLEFDKFVYLDVVRFQFFFKYFIKTKLFMGFKNQNLRNITQKVLLYFVKIKLFIENI